MYGPQGKKAQLSVFDSAEMPLNPRLGSLKTRVKMELGEGRVVVDTLRNRLCTSYTKTEC